MDDIEAAGWQAECEAVVLGLARMLRDAGRSVSGSAMLEMLRGVPRAGTDLCDLPQGALFYRVARECLKQGSEMPRIEAVCDLAKMTEPRRAMLEASIAGTILGMGMW